MPMAQCSRNAKAATDSPGMADIDAARESDHRIANNLRLLMAMVAAERREVVDPQASLALDRIVGRPGNRIVLAIPLS